MVRRALKGDTVYSIGRWLDEAGAPKPRGSSAQHFDSRGVERILRNPALAGMTPHNPGNNRGGFRGPEVLRDAEGHPVISNDAIITLDDFERLQCVLEHKDHHAAIPAARRRSNSPIIALIATCAGCGVMLNRHKTGRAYALRCNRCGQTIVYNTLAAYLVQRLLRERGSLPMYRRTWIVPGDQTASRRLAAIDLRLHAVALGLTADDADTGTLGKELLRLKQERARVRRRAGNRSAPVLADIGRTVREVWELCSTDEQRRDILAGQIQTLQISKATHHSGRVMDPARIALQWRDHTHEAIAPLGISLDAVHTQTYDPVPWISLAAAAAHVGCGIREIERAVRNGEIARRHVARCLPSLSRASVARFAEARVHST